MIHEYYTKDKLIEILVKRIRETATRKNRGTDEQEYLKRDLENIESICSNITEVMDMDQDIFTHYDWEMMNLSWVKTGIRKMTNP